MKLEITPEEATLMKDALDGAIKSAKRAQNTGKNPEIKQVYERHEASLQALWGKIATTK